jgi:hypothetical protein
VKREKGGKRERKKREEEGKGREEYLENGTIAISYGAVVSDYHSFQVLDDTPLEVPKPSQQGGAEREEGGSGEEQGGEGRSREEKGGAGSGEAQGGAGRNREEQGGAGRSREE